MVAPVTEEFFFRAFFYRALRTRLRVWSAALIDGVVFGSLHFESLDAAMILPVIAIFGVGLCLVYERTGSLFAVIAIHAAFNTFAMLGAGGTLVVPLAGGRSPCSRPACSCRGGSAPRRRPSRRRPDERVRGRGALALVLHSHMPYVEGFGTWPFGEEWLWEAVARSTCRCSTCSTARR